MQNNAQSLSYLFVDVSCSTSTHINRISLCQIEPVYNGRILKFMICISHQVNRSNDGFVFELETCLTLKDVISQMGTCSK